ncbi:MAG: restriction endonuclease subunit R, partial [Syntrophomonadaceae bacterium]|nr:restriction endonuclease subunit R [Syntrophomonadaceae bacterium]
PLLEYQELDASNANFVDKYIFSYYDSYDGDPTSDTIEQFISDLQVLMKQHSGIPASIYQQAALNGALIAFDFQQHLYAPLICLKAGGLKLTVSPVSLNDDEKDFVDKLKVYADGNAAVFEDKTLYLLRNKSKVGMGFFEAGNFYPDYVLWVDAPEKQYISFIDPKGLLHLQWNDQKIEFYSTIKGLERRLQPTCTDKTIVLNSFIMSATRSADLYQRWGKGMPERRTKHVFCLDEPDCIDGMMAMILT